ncbi:MAG: PHP domain-containing protein, partial [Clostridia bacterium]|nr:PHP domain-containing protein [Clostridia bacterium]
MDKALELGLAGICCTDHECLSGHVDFDKLRQYAKDKNSNFKIGLGNEIYLVDKRATNQRYWHFILIAKDFQGYKALRELSSTAWINSYFDRGMERVPTLKSELEQIILKYGKWHLIASSACLGSELDYCILEMD